MLLSHIPQGNEYSGNLPLLIPIGRVPGVDHPLSDRVFILNRIAGNHLTLKTTLQCRSSILKVEFVSYHVGEMGADNLIPGSAPKLQVGIVRSQIDMSPVYKHQCIITRGDHLLIASQLLFISHTLCHILDSHQIAAQLLFRTIEGSNLHTSPELAFISIHQVSHHRLTRRIEILGFTDPLILLIGCVDHAGQVIGHLILLVAKKR